MASGARHLSERLLPLLRRNHGEHVAIDLATCYGGLPAGFPPEPETVRLLHRQLPQPRRPGPGAVRTLTRLALFPFTLLFLLLYAAAVHLRRQCRRVRRSSTP